ncbi:hypothetical protein NDU88_006822 [Pleurodeles waltl]|uniref:Uncharacterized protein n=1 Tax=Pleurodeles waltl TaxID=8319 RepID=A0AAV7ML43_PLEWA|nr:hypothetical protein NDU88_006822 [Pleurodeles waltl]
MKTALPLLTRKCSAGRQIPFASGSWRAETADPCHFWIKKRRPDQVKGGRRMRAEGEEQTKTLTKGEEKTVQTAVDRKTLTETQSPAPAVREASSANSSHAWGKGWPPQEAEKKAGKGGKEPQKEGGLSVQVQT